MFVYELDESCYNSRPRPIPDMIGGPGLYLRTVHGALREEIFLRISS